MQFEYEITPVEYVASQVLYFQLSYGRERIQRAVASTLCGLVFVAVAWNERSLDLAVLLLGGTGILWIYGGIRFLFPSTYYRRGYRKTNFAGRKFKANLDAEGFEVSGDYCTWRVRWPGVKFKAENKDVFMLSSEGTIFMFGKKYLNEEQQQELRRFSGLQNAI